MATKEQYEAFKYLFDLEEQRYAQLQTKAQLYLAITTGYVLALTFSGDKAAALLSRLAVPAALPLAVAVLVTASLAFTVLAVGIRNYERVADPTEIIASLGATQPTNDAFFDDRIVDLTTATNSNATLNNRTAAFLNIAVFFLAGAACLQLIILGIGLFREVIHG